MDITPIISLFTFHISLYLESHAEHVPVFGFELAPGEGGVLVLVAGEAVEGGTHIVDTAEAVETGGLALDGFETVEDVILQTLQLLVHRAFGTLPSHGGQLVGTTVLPQDGIGVVFFLATDAVGLGQFAATAEDGDARRLNTNLLRLPTESLGTFGRWMG